MNRNRFCPCSYMPILYMPVLISNTTLAVLPTTDNKRPLVLLRLETARVRRHGFLRAAEEEWTDHVPARVSPLDHVPPVVDRHALGRRGLRYVNCSQRPLCPLLRNKAPCKAIAR